MFFETNNSNYLFDEFVEAYNRVVKLYNTNANEYGVLQTISNFKTLRGEQEKEVNELREEINDIRQQILNKIEHIEKNGRNKETKEKNKEKIGHLKYKFSQALSGGFFYSTEINDIDKSQWALNRWLDDLSRLFGGESLKEIEVLIEKCNKKYYDYKHNEAQFRALVSILSEIIRSGFKDYPDRLDTIFANSDEAKEKFNKTNAGRKFDESAPQDEIEQKVFELAQKDMFLNEDGKPKPTTIRDYIVENHPELMGEIKERALFDRVKLALEKFDMQ